MRLLLVAVDDPRASMGLPWDDQTASAGTPQPLSRGAACAVHSAWLAIGPEAKMSPLVSRSSCFLLLLDRGPPGLVSAVAGLPLTFARLLRNIFLRAQ